MTFDIREITGIRTSDTIQLNVQHSEESTSPPNSPMFVIKKKSRKWTMLTDLITINKVIQPMVSS